MLYILCVLADFITILLLGPFEPMDTQRIIHTLLLLLLLLVCVWGRSRYKDELVP